MVHDDEESFIRAPTDCPEIRINKWRVREDCPISVGHILLFYYPLGSATAGDGKDAEKSLCKLKATKSGVVKKKLCKEGDVVKAGEAIMQLSPCDHTTVIKDMCADCGEDLRRSENNTSEAFIPMVHSEPDLKVTQQLAQKLGRDDTKRLLESRKLVLLVDLDQTIIHTTNDNVPNNVKGIYHFQLYGPQSPWYHTRLRPKTLQFLKNISEFYELHICTFGARNYAHMIAQILDPDGKYFSDRILSRDECFNATSKTDNLKALFPNGDSMVCIIDDREDVWNMALNLIQVKPYHFFQHTGDINAPPGLSKHELDGEGIDFEDLKSISKSESDKEKFRAHGESDEEQASGTIGGSSSNARKANEKSLHSQNVKMRKAKVSSAEDSGTNINSTNDESSCDGNAPATRQTANSPSPNTSRVTDQRVFAGSSKPVDSQEQIEIEDPDDYLFDLENILKNIHSRFYQIYDDTEEIPDLKIIVPKIRSEVLRGQSLVFSGLVQTNIRLEHSRAYFIAKSLGAEVTQDIDSDTTHLVAVTSGTVKVNAAKKYKSVKVVNTNWLWSCAERWEHVDERLFPLDRKIKGKQRNPPAHCHSPEHVVDYTDKSEISQFSIAQQLQLHNEDGQPKFCHTLNPLLSFSNDDIADMNQEFAQFFNSGTSSSDDESVNIESPPEERRLRKRKRRERHEERTREFFTRQPGEPALQALTDSTTDMPAKTSDSSSSDDSSSEGSKGNKESDDESPRTKFRRGEGLPSDFDVDSESGNSENDNPDSDPDNGTWNMMGAALEREFLGLDEN